MTAITGSAAASAPGPGLRRGRLAFDKGYPD